MELLFTPSMCVSISTAAAHPASTTISPSEIQRMQTWNPETSYSSQRSHMTSALQKMQTSTSHSASALPYQHNSCHSKTSNSNENPSTSSFLPTPTSAPFSTAVNMVSTTSSISRLHRTQTCNARTSCLSQKLHTTSDSQTKCISMSYLLPPKSANQMY